MTLVVIGPVTRDLVVIGDEKSQKTGGAIYFQSFVFEEFYKEVLVEKWSFSPLKTLFERKMFAERYEVGRISGFAWDGF